MTDIQVAFWNLENLFDLTSSETALIHEFTPDRGWTQEVLDKKIENLAEIIKLLNNGQGPDLFGICEVENEKVTQKLLDKIGRRDYRIAMLIIPMLQILKYVLFTIVLVMIMDCIIAIYEEKYLVDYDRIVTCK